MANFQLNIPVKQMKVTTITETTEHFAVLKIKEISLSLPKQVMCYQVKYFHTLYLEITKMFNHCIHSKLFEIKN